jgi:hypothetical protein
MAGVSTLPEVIEVDWGRLDPVVERMAELTAAMAGWINVQAGIDPEDAPRADAGLFGLFSGRGPVVATWTAPVPRRRGPPEPASVGIQHPAGPRAVSRLAESGLPVPAGWRVLQDHPRRGLVIAVTPDTPPADVLAWLLDATARLSGVPVTGEWRASVYRG